MQRVIGPRRTWDSLTALANELGCSRNALQWHLDRVGPCAYRLKPLDLVKYHEWHATVWEPAQTQTNEQETA